MSGGAGVEGVLLTGVFGVGKSSVAAEIAELLERWGLPYGALDLDWLMWFDTGDEAMAGADLVFLKNLSEVVGNYCDAGVRRLVLAGSVRDAASLRDIREAVAAPLRVVRLTVPLEEIDRRLQADVTTGRRDDLREAARWLKESVGVGLEDLTVENDGPIQQVAATIVGWLGWVP